MQETTEDQSSPGSLHRREFVKITTGCALLVALGGVSMLHGCTAARIYNTTVSNKEIRIPVSEFAKDKMRTIRIPKWKYDILVVKNSDTQFTAMLLQCTHRQYELNVNAKGINCPAHGSAFNFDGKVLQGPATHPLEKYNTRIEGTDLIIKI